MSGYKITIISGLITFAFRYRSPRFITPMYVQYAL
jgi:hypothetical protein